MAAPQFFENKGFRDMIVSLCQAPWQWSANVFPQCFLIQRSLPSLLSQNLRNSTFQVLQFCQIPVPCGFSGLVLAWMPPLTLLQFLPPVQRPCTFSCLWPYFSSKNISAVQLLWFSNLQLDMIFCLQLILSVFHVDSVFPDSRSHYIPKNPFV